MLQSAKLIAQGRGLAPVLLRRAPAVELDWDIRQKSRFDAPLSDGRTLAVFLPRGTVLRGGDALLTTGGELVRVVAAAQPVLRISACPDHATATQALDLLRAAYHLGNRHVPVELHADHLQIEPDHVLADMLRAMHLTVTALNAPFEPAGGAYGDHGHGGGHGHGHGHGHDHHGHDHDHASGHHHGPAHDHAHDHPHGG